MYFGIWIALLICTGITYKAAILGLGRFNAAVALGIATLKATLVALFFMHVWHASEKLTKLVVSGGTILPAAATRTHDVRLRDAVVELGSIGLILPIQSAVYSRRPFNYCLA